MPRMARLDSLGLLHHIMIRRIERRKIFNDDKEERGQKASRLGSKKLGSGGWEQKQKAREKES
jgi:hypothetical protein